MAKAIKRNPPKRKTSKSKAKVKARTTPKAKAAAPSKARRISSKPKPAKAKPAKVKRPAAARAAAKAKPSKRAVAKSKAAPRKAARTPAPKPASAKRAKPSRPASSKRAGGAVRRPGRAVGVGSPVVATVETVVISAAPSGMPRKRFENPLRPPKNRRTETLPVLHLEIVHAGGTTVMDPNRILMALLGEEWASAFPPIPTLASELSGAAGGVIYRAEDFELNLAPDELRRLHLRALTPSEALYLLDRYGMAHDWHDDFYHPETGEAFQPKVAVPPDSPVPGALPPG